MKGIVEELKKEKLKKRTKKISKRYNLSFAIFYFQVYYSKSEFLILILIISISIYVIIKLFLL